MIKEALLTLACCLIVTEILEIGTSLLLGIRSRRDILTVFLVNTLTNPLAVLLNMAAASFTALPSYAVIAVLEIAAWLTEALIYKKLLDFRKISPFILSLILNAVSFIIGSFAVSLIC